MGDQLLDLALDVNVSSPPLGLADVEDEGGAGEGFV